MNSEVPTALLNRYQGVLWSLPVLIDGTEETFLLDTAAGITILDQRVASRLGVTVRDSVTARRMTGEEITLPIGGPTEIEIGGRSIRHDTVGIHDLASLLPGDWPPVGGALGLTTFAHQPIVIDLARGELRLVSRDRLEGVVADLAPLRIRLEPARTHVLLDVFVEMTTLDGARWLELDTGNTGPIILSEETAEALGVPSDTKEATFEIAGLGPVKTPAVVRPIIHDGNLGSSFLENRRLVLDLARERAWLSSG